MLSYLPFPLPSSHMHQILYLLNKSHIYAPPFTLISYVFYISSPQPILVLHDVSVLLRSFQWCLSSIQSNLNFFVCSPLIQPQFPFHRILEALAVVSNFGYVASPMEFAHPHFFLAFLMLFSLPGIPSASYSSFQAQLRGCLLGKALSVLPQKNLHFVYSVHIVLVANLSFHSISVWVKRAAF